MRKVDDYLSAVLLRVLDFLFIKHPGRTSVGVVLGIVFQFLVSLFAPAISRIPYINVSRVMIWHWIALGILVTHFPTLCGYLFVRPRGNESIDDAIRLIKHADVSELERRMMWRQLVQNVLQNVVLSNKIAAETLLIRRAMDIDSDTPKS